MHPLDPPRGPARRRAAAAAALALALTASTAACTGGDDDPPPPAQSTDAGAQFRIETETTLGEVVGRLPRPDRRRVAEAVTRVVQRWFDAAYVGGRYPRSRFADAFPGFTAGARAEARRDRALMSNAALGPQIERVTPTASRLRLDVLAPGGRASAVTARFVLAFRTEGERRKRVRVQGRLLLSRPEGQWRIFGYDVTREVR